MSLALLETSIPTWVAGLTMLVLMLCALGLLLTFGASRPHS